MHQWRGLSIEPVEPWLRVVLVEHGQRLDTRLRQPVKLEGHSRGTVHECCNALAKILGKAMISHKLIRALPEKRSRASLLPATRADKVEQVPELRRFERSHLIRTKAADEQDRGQRVVAPQVPDPLMARNWYRR